MNFLSGPVLVGLLCQLSRLTAPFNQGIQPSKQFCRSLSISAFGKDDSTLNMMEHIRELRRENSDLQCEIFDLRCELKILKNKECDIERLASMVYETHRRFRHLMAELDLNCGTLSQSKVEQHYQQIQKRKNQGNKEILRVLKTEASPEYQFLRDFRNAYAHHSTLDLNHLAKWKSQLKRFLMDNVVDNVETRLAKESYYILDDIISFLSNPKNRNSIQYHRSMEKPLSPMNADGCKFGLEKELSQRRLKKIFKKKNSDCCGNVELCAQKALLRLKQSGYTLSPTLERKLARKINEPIFDANNPFKDAHFNSKEVSKSLRFKKEAAEELQGYLENAEDEEDEYEDYVYADGEVEDKEGEDEYEEYYDGVH